MTEYSLTYADDRESYRLRDDRETEAREAVRAWLKGLHADKWHAINKTTVHYHPNPERPGEGNYIISVPAEIGIEAALNKSKLEKSSADKPRHYETLMDMSNPQNLQIVIRENALDYLLKLPPQDKPVGKSQTQVVYEQLKAKCPPGQLADMSPIIHRIVGQGDKPAHYRIYAQDSFSPDTIANLGVTRIRTAPNPSTHAVLPMITVDVDATELDRVLGIKPASELHASREGASAPDFTVDYSAEDDLRGERMKKLLRLQFPDLSDNIKQVSFVRGRVNGQGQYNVVADAHFSRGNLTALGFTQGEVAKGTHYTAHNYGAADRQFIIDAAPLDAVLNSKGPVRS